MNRICIMGRLCKDPELRYTQDQTPVTSFSVAVDRFGKDSGADFFDVVAWRKTAEFINQYFTKGQQVAIDGRLQSRKWQDRDGNNRVSVEIVAENVNFCGSKQDNGGNRGTPSQRDQKKGAVEPVEDFDALTDDVPF